MIYNILCWKIKKWHRETLMSNVMAFPAQASASALMAVNRLDDIWETVESFSLQLQYEPATLAEMMRVLRILNTAKSCVRIVLLDFKDDPAIEQLVDHSREITGMIDEAREKVASLIEASHDRAACPAPIKRLGD